MHPHRGIRQIRADTEELDPTVLYLRLLERLDEQAVEGRPREPTVQRQRQTTRQA